MKKILYILLLIFSIITNAQVGINTSNPQQVFHVDGKSTNESINPEVGQPTIAQQKDDVVITTNGQVGIGTIFPTEALEVNGKTKINDLPINGTNGFTAINTLVSDNNGVIGSIKGLPPAAYDGYYLTNLQGFKTENATSRNYSYANIVYQPINTYSYKPDPNITFTPVYSINFDSKSQNSNKFMQLNIDYAITANGNNNIVIAKPTYTGFNLFIILNGVQLFSFSSRSDYPAGGAYTNNLNKFFTIDLSNHTLLAQNNKLDIVISLKDQQNIFKHNEGTEDGQYNPNNTSFLNLKVTDLSFQLFEK